MTKRSFSMGFLFQIYSFTLYVILSLFLIFRHIARVKKVNGQNFDRNNERIMIEVLKEFATKNATT